jgi:hypothetical protein
MLCLSKARGRSGHLHSDITTLFLLSCITIPRHFQVVVYYFCYQLLFNNFRYKGAGVYGFKFEILYYYSEFISLSSQLKDTSVFKNLR